jgi:hypothetical protein
LLGQQAVPQQLPEQQVSLQQVSPLVQAEAHTSFWHVMQGPQSVGSHVPVVELQWVQGGQHICGDWSPQAGMPSAQTHFPLEQLAPAGHTLPQLPQFLGSLWTLAQFPLQHF